MGTTRRAAARMLVFASLGVASVVWAEARVVEMPFMERVTLQHDGCSGSEECYELAGRLETMARQQVRDLYSSEGCLTIAQRYGYPRGRLESISFTSVDMIPGQSSRETATFAVQGEARCVAFRDQSRSDEQQSDAPPQQKPTQQRRSPQQQEAPDPEETNETACMVALAKKCCLQCGARLDGGKCIGVTSGRRVPNKQSCWKSCARKDEASCKRRVADPNQAARGEREEPKEAANAEAAPSRKTGADYHKEGRDAIIAGRADEAIPLFQRAVAEGYVTSHGQLARIFFQRGDRANCAKHARAYLDRYPDAGDAQPVRGMLAKCSE